MELQEAITLWKKLNIKTCTMDFNCGGDSMGDTSFLFSDENGDVSSKELTDFFEDVVYSRVDFYVNSDGHYQGESGTVDITLNDDEDDFEYAKTAKAEYSESHTSVTEIKLSPKMIDFVKEYVLNINGSEGSDVVTNFKREFIMTNEQEKLQEKIEEKIHSEISKYVPTDLDLDDEEGIDDWFTFTTNDEDNDKIRELTIKGNSLLIIVRNSYTEYRDSD